MLAYQEFSNKSESVVFNAQQIEEQRNAKAQAQRKADEAKKEQMKKEGLGEYAYTEVFAAI